MPTKKFYIADWHYGHKNILHFDNRPFLSVEEMNNALVSRWNSVVSSGDLVYVIGDMFWCTPKAAIPILDQLNGQKVLIKGNHDDCSDPDFKRRFVQISDYLEVKDGKDNIVLCHYPIPCFKNHYYNWKHLYGHVHRSFEYNITEHSRILMEELYDKPCEMINVGAMMPWMDYTPKTFEEILEGYYGFAGGNGNE